MQPGSARRNLAIFFCEQRKVSAMLRCTVLPSEYLSRGKSDPVVDIGKHPRSPLGQLARSNDVVHIGDLAASPAYLEREARIVTLVETAKARTLLAVPMLDEKQLVGAIVIYRQEVRPFTEKQIELVKSFAAQAVVAIQNARLLNDLRESLTQQTATSEVLQVISRSPSELEPVFNAILENATRICEAKVGNLMLWEGDGFRAVAVHGEAAFTDRRRVQPKITTSEWPALPQRGWPRANRLSMSPI